METNMNSDSEDLSDVEGVVSQAIDPSTSIQTSSKKKSFWAPKHRIFVKGLPFQCQLEEVRRFFGNYGNITNFTEQRDSKGKYNGEVIIKYSSEVEMNNSLIADKFIWDGSGGDGVRFIRVSEYVPPKKSKITADEKNSKNDKKQIFKLVIGSLHANSTEAEVMELFHNGDEKACLRVKLAREEPTTEGELGKLKGFGHVFFHTADQRDSALLLDRKLRLHGHVLTVRSPGLGEEAGKEKQKKLASRRMKNKNSEDQEKGNEKEERTSHHQKKRFRKDGGGTEKGKETKDYRGKKMKKNSSTPFNLSKPTTSRNQKSSSSTSTSHSSSTSSTPSTTSSSFSGFV